MNCNLQGKRLSTDELIEIAKRIGVTDDEIEAHTAALHSEGLIRSWLSTRTANERFDMLFRGELILDTTLVPNQEIEPVKLDMEAVRFFKRNM